MLKIDPKDQKLGNLAQEHRETWKTFRIQWQNKEEEEMPGVEPRRKGNKDRTKKEGH